MGQGHPSSQRSLESNVLDKLAKETHYDKKEIKQLHSQFYTEVPSGFIPKEVCIFGYIYKPVVVVVITLR